MDTLETPKQGDLGGAYGADGFPKEDSAVSAGPKDAAAAGAVAESRKRGELRDKRRIVIKIGSSSLTHEETGDLNLLKIERLVRVIGDLKGRGKDVVLVSSGAIATGRQAMGYPEKPKELPVKQALAAVGQARLMMVYQKIFSEYSQVAAQILMTKDTMMHEPSRINARNTFEELLKLGAIPIVNENDTISTSEIPLVDNFGDNDRLSALVCALIGADLLILLSDIDGLYTDDPRANADARLISFVPQVTQELLDMGKEATGSSLGIGGMAAKLKAAMIATDSGADLVIANGENVEVIDEIIGGAGKGTLFTAHKRQDFHLIDYLNAGYENGDGGSDSGCGWESSGGI
ncbi:MAG: glutamate 5-kinase [Lachnospiraceae bacterium]|jgi:glutamate 5-kinase|nr:glutamate 5-kinase [Lachnospiraceae bacterium]